MDDGSAVGGSILLGGLMSWTVLGVCKRQGGWMHVLGAPVMHTAVLPIHWRGKVLRFSARSAVAD